MMSWLGFTRLPFLNLDVDMRGLLEMIKTVRDLRG